MQCSKINTHSSKCMILLECLTHSLVPESSPTPSHSPKPRMRIVIFICLLVDNPPMCRYQLGRLRRLILFMDYPPIYQLGHLRRLIFLVLDNPQININIFRQPFEPFSLDSSPALTPIVLGCSSAYGMHVCQFQYSLIHM